MQYVFEDVKKKFAKGNKILFDRDSACLKKLACLMDETNHARLTLWAFDCLNSALTQLKSAFSDCPLFDEAVFLCRKWAFGEEKMPRAKNAILKVHAFAKTITDKTHIALCHALGQAVSCVHVQTHALGLPLYELSAVVFKFDGRGFENAVQEKIEHYTRRLAFWRTADITEYRLAPFLIK